MELRSIEVFLALADELHFRRTAQRLHLTTGRVSQIVQSLEKEVGGELFARTSRQVQLTALGEQLRKDIRPAHAQILDVVERARLTAASAREILRVGYPATVSAKFVAHLADECQARNPALDVVTFAQFECSGFASLQEGLIDVLLAWTPVDGTDLVTGHGLSIGPVLAKTTRAVLVPSDHALARHREISVETLAARHVVLDIGREMSDPCRSVWLPTHTPRGTPLRCADAGPTNIYRHRRSSILDVMTLVQRLRLPYLTVASLPWAGCYPGLALVPVSDLPPCMLISVWRGGNDTPPVHAFTSIAP
ncbi:LysR family transcriptional regulator [Nocardia carnea]|uniref:LysR family transcriptional regulator n=1 Tax=Nocardia carnea TaxID=37328 RepID=UPI0024553434|nr:LysR family transcriptional regulator [Nocardia carnea]